MFVTQIEILSSSSRQVGKLISLNSLLELYEKKVSPFVFNRL